MKDTEGDVQGQDPRRGELQLVVEQRTVGENPLLDAGLHRTLKNKVQGSEPTDKSSEAAFRINSSDLDDPESVFKCLN